MTDLCVGERIALVAEERGHGVAAAHPQRYRADEEAGRATGTPARSTGSSGIRPPPSGRAPSRRPTR
ncbi:hypothetical protein ACWDY4_21635 [Streptomyces olivaceoviridis]